MKTKIIYISGNELFDMTDIRSAFEEVRAALSLGSDTILFGVPVDNDDAFVAQPVAEPVADPVIESAIKPTDEPVTDIGQKVTASDTEANEKKPTLRRTARKSAKVVPISDAIAPKQNVSEPEPETTNETTPVVPILSVLGTKSDDIEAPDFVEPVAATEIKTVDQTTPDDIDAQPVTISDMIADDAPQTEHEKTLEELLESMTPLGEDAEKSDDTQTTTEPDDVAIEQDVKSDNELDMTLEKLATEFVENQDKINVPTKPAARGKIGKLKSILPFSKAKNNDNSGLMGDLFGWAGVAANDEDFTIPGFFK